MLAGAGEATAFVARTERVLVSVQALKKKGHQREISAVLGNALSYSLSSAAQRSKTPRGQIVCFELKRREQVI